MVLQEKLTTTGQILLLRMVRESSPLIFVVVEGGQKLTHIIIHLRAQKNEQAVPDGPPKLVLLGNTHLFYHPKAQHIRLMQARDGSTTSAFVHTSKPLAHSHLSIHQSTCHATQTTQHQAYTLLKEMERRQDLVEAQHGARPLLVLCGDLNSCVFGFCDCVIIWLGWFLGGGVGG